MNITSKKLIKFKCSGCTFESRHMSTVSKHLGKKEKCSHDELKVLKIEYESTENDDVHCTYCGKFYGRISSLEKHKSICKKNQEKEIKEREREKEFDNMRKELEDMKKIINKQETNIKCNNNITNITNIGNVNIMVNNLTAYDDPFKEMEEIKEYMKASLKKKFLAVPTLIGNIHFNEKYPQNMNISVTNKRNKEAKVFDGERWKTVDKDELINEIINSYERELEDFALEQGDTDYQEKYERIKNRGGNGEEDLKKCVHDVMYDNNKMVNTKIHKLKSITQ